MDEAILTSSGSFKVIKSIYKNKEAFKKIRIIELIPEGTIALSKSYKIVDKEIYEKAKKEEKLLSSFQHSKIVKYIKFFHYTLPNKGISYYDIVMEYCKKGNLAGVLDEMKYKKNKFSSKILLRSFFDLIDVLAFLQNAKIAHRDIKPENILVGDNDELKLADFGDGKIDIKEFSNTLAGSKTYMSPVLLQGLKNFYSTNIFKVDHNIFKSDVYSLGLVFYYMTTMRTPKAFSQATMNEMLTNIEGLKNEYIKKLLKLMLAVNEEDRPDFIELSQLMIKIKNKAVCAVCFEVINQINCICKVCCYGFHINCLKNKKLCISCKTSLLCSNCGENYLHGAENCSHDFCKICHENTICDSHLELMENCKVSYYSQITNCVTCCSQLAEIDGVPYCSYCEVFMCRICRFPHDQNVICLLAYISHALYCQCGNQLKYVQSQLFIECSKCGPVCRVCFTQSIKRSHINCSHIISSSLM